MSFGFTLVLNDDSVRLAARMIRRTDGLIKARKRMATAFDAHLPFLLIAKRCAFVKAHPSRILRFKVHVRLGVPMRLLVPLQSIFLASGQFHRFFLPFFSRSASALCRPALPEITVDATHRPRSHRHVARSARQISTLPTPIDSSQLPIREPRLIGLFLSAAFVASLSGFLFGATLFGPRCGNSFDVDELAALVSLSGSLDLTGFGSAVLRT